MLYWILKSLALGPVIKLLFRPWVEGLENVPAKGPAILASNHLSFSDSIFLPLVVPRRITFPAKMEYFTGKGLKGRLTAAFFRGVGQIPIDRSGGRASQAALTSGLKVLREGDLFGIYPEGTRSPDGRLYRGKTGVARMALEAGCPVLPVAMIGTEKAQPTGQVVPNIMRVGIRIGKPLDFSRYAGMEDDRYVLRAITDEIMYELMLLSGQEYVDEYAANRKKNLLDSARDQAKVATDKAVARAKEVQAEAAARAKEVQTEAVARAKDVQTDAVARAKGLGEQAIGQAKGLQEQTVARLGRGRDTAASAASSDEAAADLPEQPASAEAAEASPQG